MTEAALHAYLCWALIGLGVLTFIALLFITAPYGRHYQDGGWGPTVSNRIGWILMELPSVVVFAVIYAQGAHSTELVPVLLLSLWQLHYVHRTFIFPFRMRTTGKRMPVLIMCLGASFNCFNSYLNARWISEFGAYDATWLQAPYLWIGGLIFLAGFALNVHSDSVLFNLRKPGETGYRIPEGGAYRFVSSPNYLGELLEWLGWAIATWSICGLAFFIYTAANLVPRAISNHRWYHETFEEYPHERRRIIPGIF